MIVPILLGYRAHPAIAQTKLAFRRSLFTGIGSNKRERHHDKHTNI
jgi:hypothetical protein